MLRLGGETEEDAAVVGLVKFSWSSSSMSTFRSMSFYTGKSCTAQPLVFVCKTPSSSTRKVNRAT
jgi:hypothetical protein